MKQSCKEEKTDMKVKEQNSYYVLWYFYSRALIGRLFSVKLIQELFKSA